MFEITQRGDKYYFTGRLLDPSKPALVDNIEFEGPVTYGRDTRQELADWLNEREAQKAV